MIKSVYIFPNGMTAVTDEKGQQMVFYQGHWKEVRSKIMRDRTDDTKFNYPDPLDYIKKQDGYDLDERNQNIARDIEVACGKCTATMKLDEKDPRVARGFDCDWEDCKHKTRVYVKYKK